MIMTDIYGYEDKKLNIIMFNMATFFDWDHGVVNRNYFIMNELAKDERINKIIGVDFLPATIKKGIAHYFKNILWEVKSAEMVYGDLTSACYQRTSKIYAYSTIDSVFSYKTVARELRRIERILNLKNIIFWSYNPMFVEFIGRLNEKLFVFDAVDNWSEHPSYLKLMRRRKLLKNYQAIAEKADLVFTVSSGLVDFFQNLGRKKTTLWAPNGVDFAHFNDPAFINKDNVLSKIDKPIIGYLGTIECRVDIDLIAKISREHKDKIIALCGPVWPSIKSELHRKLKYCKNVLLIGRVKYNDAPSYLNKFNVAIIPHKINEFIKSTNPMKMYDYLAAGKPIVSTMGAGIEMFGKEIYATNDADEFCRFIDKALKENSAEKQAERRRLVAKHSWTSRANIMLENVFEMIKL